MDRLTLEREGIAWLASQGEPVRIPSRGRSMEPLVREGDILELVRLNDAPRIGDVVVFSGPDGLVAHRVIGRRLKQDQFLEKGDRAPRASWIARALIHGRVCRIVRNGVELNLDTPGRRLAARLIAGYSWLACHLQRIFFPNGVPRVVARISGFFLGILSKRRS